MDRPRPLWFALLVAGGCGRIAFDGAVDGSIGADGESGPLGPPSRVAARFEGPSSRILIASFPALDELSIGNATIELWVYADHFAGADMPLEGVRVLEGSEPCFPTQAYWVVDFQPSGAPELEIYALRPADSVLVSGHTYALGTIAALTWTHVAIVFDRDRSEVRYHLDGALVATMFVGDSTFWTSTGGGCPLQLSSRWNSFFGALDEVRFWSFARGQQDIARTRDVELTGSEPGLVAYWPMETDLDDCGPNHVGHSVVGSVALIPR